jgi:hypothetical protein
LLPLSHRPACWPGGALQARISASKLAGQQSGSKLPYSKSISKLNERPRNVYENKGAVWKNRGEAGICMKKKDLSVNTGNIVENKGGYNEVVCYAFARPGK